MVSQEGVATKEMKFVYDDKYATKPRDEERYDELFQYVSKGNAVGDAVAQYWLGILL